MRSLNDFNAEFSSILAKGCPFSFLSLGNGRALFGSGQKTFTPSEVSFPCFYLPGYFLQSKTPFYLHEVMEIVPHAFFDSGQGKNSRDSSWHLSALEPFNDAFSEVYQGRLKKAVPYLKESRSLPLKLIELSEMAASSFRYEKENPTTRSFGFFDSGSGFMGCTPEALIKKTGSHVFSMACAGTLPKDQVDQLLSDEKLAFEHKVVVDAIQEGFRSFGSLSIGQTKAAPFKSLSHLVTEVQLELKKEVSLHALVSSIHPTPALGAYPKGAGLEWLKAYDLLVPRGEFGAPFGVVLSEKEAEAYILIRKAAWNKHEFYLIAGCGIVASSQIEKEIAEVKLKLKAIREILSL